MKTAIAQIKLKTCDFDFNYENIIKNIENIDCDLLIFLQFLYLFKVDRLF